MRHEPLTFYTLLIVSQKCMRKILFTGTFEASICCILTPKINQKSKLEYVSLYSLTLTFLVSLA